MTAEHVAALRSAEANEFAAKQVPDLRTRLERQQAATLRAKEALAAEEQKCKELQAQLEAQARPADRKGQKTALEKEKQAATKAGNLELAMAIKAKQEALTVDAVVTNAAGRGSDLLGDGKPDLAKLFVGSWEVRGAIWTVLDNGNVSSTSGASFTWKVDKDSIIVIPINNLFVNIVSKITESDAVLNTNIQMKKIK